MKEIPQVCSIVTALKKIISTIDADAVAAFAWFCFITAISILASYVLILE